MRTTPVGVPSGWEEEAAFFMCTGRIPVQENIKLLTEQMELIRLAATLQRMPTYWDMDWRVLE